MWLVGVHPSLRWKTAQAIIEANWRSMRRRAGRAADVELDVAFYTTSPSFEPDDVVIVGEAESERKPLTVAKAPARVVQVVPAPTRSKPGAALVYLRRPTGTPLVDWVDVQAAVRHNGGRLGASWTIVRQVCELEQKKSLLGLWR
jgi:hypothetical protein